MVLPSAKTRSCAPWRQRQVAPRPKWISIGTPIHPLILHEPSNGPIPR